MIRLKRRNTAWLVAMGFLIMFALLAAPGISAAVQLSLIGAFVVAMIASMVEIGPDRETLIDVLQRAPIRRRITPQAREAAERAASSAGYFARGLVMLDVGLIALQTGMEGLAMRRTRNISKDDDGARPFITLYVHPEEAERQAVIRFEIYNQLGEEQYVHEMKTYLREGELNILADHHLPLAGNRGVDGSGDWDLRVYVDGNLIGMHNLMLSPSVTERRRRLSGEAEYSGNLTRQKQNNNLKDMVIVDEVEQPEQTKLGDLLQQQNPSGRSGYSRNRK